MKYVRSLPGTYYLRTEAAEAIGCAQSLLPYLSTQHPDADLGPTHRASYGNVEILLYTPERVEHIRAFLEENNQGKKPTGQKRVFSPAELQERRRMGGRMREYRKRAITYEADGRIEDAEDLRAAADDLAAELVRTKAVRVKELTRKRHRKQ